MRRWEFVALLGCASTAWRLNARAQQPNKSPTIGFLFDNAAANIPWTKAFAERFART
jgi:hypothetical protein